MKTVKRTIDVAAARNILRERGRRALEPAVKGMYMCAACDAVWTKTRLAEANYVIDDVRCEKCGSLDDTIHHRVWVCNSPECKTLREATAPRWRIDEAVAAGPTSVFHNRGLLANAADLAVGPPAQPYGKFFRDGVEVVDEAQWTMEGHVYYDGSCDPVKGSRELSRASWGVVQVDDDGKVVSTMRGVVPSFMPQTAQSGEHMGRTMAVQALCGETTLSGDCRNVVDDVGKTT